MRNRSAASDVREEPSSLYQMIVEATGVEYTKKQFSEGIEQYKNKMVRVFGDMSEDEFDELAPEVTDWVNEATTQFNANKRAKEPSPLPDIDGLEEEPVKARRGRVSVVDDEDDEPPAPPAGRRRSARPEPEPDDEDEPEPEPEPEPAPARAARGSARRTAATAPTSTRTAPAPAAPRRDPDSGRYAKVMPHYLKHRDITIEQLQDRIEKGDGDTYSETTLDRTLAACRSVVGWLERNGVNLDRLSR